MKRSMRLTLFLALAAVLVFAGKWDAGVLGSEASASSDGLEKRFVRTTMACLLTRNGAM
jgi:hypothetical protein